MNKIKIPAYGKINLFLDIKNLRDDGYHNLEMVLQTIKLHDNIMISARRKGINISTNSKEIPTDENNLAHKAATVVLERAEINKGVNIHIEKNIPVAAGLAGGSTDAAAVIKGLNKLFALDYSYENLHKLAAGIGSDVPFCLKGGTAFASKRGEQLEYLPSLKKKWVILIKPPKIVSTKEIYQLYDEMKVDKNIPVKKLLAIIKKRKEINIKDGWANVLEPVTKKIVKDVAVIESKLFDYGFDFTMMTGSGPTVFSLIDQDEIEKAKQVIDNWERDQDFITLTQTFK